MLTALNTSDAYLSCGQRVADKASSDRRVEWRNQENAGSSGFSCKVERAADWAFGQARPLGISFGNAMPARSGSMRTSSAAAASCSGSKPTAGATAVNRHAKGTPYLECAPEGGQIGRFELTPIAGLPEDGSHDEASLTQRRVQAAGR